MNDLTGIREEGMALRSQGHLNALFIPFIRLPPCPAKLLVGVICTHYVKRPTNGSSMCHVSLDSSPIDLFIEISCPTQLVLLQWSSGQQQQSGRGSNGSWQTLYELANLLSIVYILCSYGRVRKSLVYH